MSGTDVHEEKKKPAEAEQSNSCVSASLCARKLVTQEESVTLMAQQRQQDNETIKTRRTSTAKMLFCEGVYWQVTVIAFQIFSVPRLSPPGRNDCKTCQEENKHETWENLV